ncbi:Protein of unknown function [Pyronema omphalodes CBS 100304]|uniref:Uncharacterized protein n=1 Tax=Pyronema omphalodes (strain CBS 100304) TaxID=1076935 RepID=U4LHB1_PYROM|nr:Protein of unknown function [Pyronema omphalodes CBS 100304]
MDHTHYKR